MDKLTYARIRVVIDRKQRVFPMMSCCRSWNSVIITVELIVCIRVIVVVTLGALANGEEGAGSPPGVGVFERCCEI